MKGSRNLLVFALVLFGVIAGAALFKKKPQSGDEVWVSSGGEPITLDLDGHEPEPTEAKSSTDFDPSNPIAQSAVGLPDADRIDLLFRTDEPKLPIVETIKYTSSVPWLKGRPAWLADYAAHFKTSRHFLARSLSGGRPDYESQRINNGDYFNVLRSDHDISFHLVVDLSRAKMWFYSYDETEDERVLLKTYPVGLGRPDPTRGSGFLTPKGTYLLGDRIAIYKPGVMGHYEGKKTEMIRVFGTRWIPFEKEIGKCTAPARGFGIHGSPFILNDSGTKLVEQRESVGKYESDGCIRLTTEDIEEVFSIVITRPTYIQLVSDFNEAELPGKEAYY